MKRKLIIAAIAAHIISGLVILNSKATSVSTREMLLSIPVTANLGGDTTRPIVAPNAFSFPAANLPPENVRPFSFGNRLFNTNWVEAPASVKSFDGLGPLFNRVSCSGCHTKDGRGQPPENGVGPMDTMLFRISAEGYGDQLNERGINGVAPEGIAKITYTEVQGKYGTGEPFSLRHPTYSIEQAAYGMMPRDVAISPRVAPQVIGLGLLEAVPEKVLLDLADADDRNGDGISGRVNQVWSAGKGQSAIGRFGWKSSQPDLLNQNAAAAIGDVGLTTRIHMKENCSEAQIKCRNSMNGGTPELKDEFLEKLTLYTATLAVPSQRNADSASVVKGAKLFREMGCASCHMPTLKTGEHPLSALSNQTFHPYTDLLLHDMGKALADNRPDFEATGQEWRTPPLWGLGLVPTVNGHNRLLHDGRARGFEEAILWHGGEAETAKEKFRNAPKLSRDALVEFLKSL